MADHFTRTPAPVHPHHPGDSDPDMDEALRRARAGRLLVDHDAGLGLGPALKPLADVPDGQTVTTTGRIDSLTVAGTRVLLLLADSNGDTATVIVPSTKFMTASRSIGRPITVGDTVQLHGTVSARFEHMPKLIDVFAFRAARLIPTARAI